MAGLVRHGFSLSDLSCGLTGVAVRKYYQQFLAWYIFNFCKALFVAGILR